MIQHTYDTAEFWLSGAYDTAEFWLSGACDTAEFWLSGAYDTADFDSAVPMTLQSFDSVVSNLKSDYMKLSQVAAVYNILEETGDISRGNCLIKNSFKNCPICRFHESSIFVLNTARIWQVLACFMRSFLIINGMIRWNQLLICGIPISSWNVTRKSANTPTITVLQHKSTVSYII